MKTVGILIVVLGAIAAAHAGEIVVIQWAGTFDIPDNGEYAKSEQVGSAPPKALVTAVSYEVLVDDRGAADNFWCSDYEIGLSSTARGGTGNYLLVWDNGGKQTDIGEDDDTADDSDIDLSRLTHAFNGQAVNQRWYASIKDNVSHAGAYKGLGCVKRVKLTIHFPTSLPAASTEAATGITTTTATLNGTVTNDGGEACQYQFRYKKQGGAYTYTSYSGSKRTGESFSYALTGLDPNSVYYFAARAKNSAGESDWPASDLSLPTPPVIERPTVTTQAATNITTTGATLWGTIANDGGEACQYQFRYKKQGGAYTYTSYSGSKQTGESFSQSVTGLDPGASYYFAARAKNSAGESAWPASDLSFGTPSVIERPTVTTQAATGVGAHTATLNGTVTDDGGETCQYRFAYGTTRQQAPPPSSWADTGYEGAAGTGQSVSKTVSGLTRCTTYYFFFQAKNSAGEGTGGSLPQQFTTLADTPSVSTEPADVTSMVTATLKAKIDDDGGKRVQQYQFRYKRSGDPSYIERTPINCDLSTGSSFSESISGLLPLDSYVFSARAINADGTGNWSSDGRFYIEIGPIQMPTATTQAATRIGETTATLNGTVASDGGEACQYRFRYKAEGGAYSYTAYAGPKRTGESFSLALTNLWPGTVYHFAAQVWNSAGESAWPTSDLTFLTPGEPYAVVTEPATDIDATSAVLHGRIPNYAGEPYWHRFRFGGRIVPTVMPESTTWLYSPWVEAAQGAGATFSQIVTGLLANTPYEFFAQIKKEGGGTEEQALFSQRFTTLVLKKPTVKTLPVTNVGPRSVTFGGSIVDDGNQECAYYFKYSCTSGGYVVPINRASVSILGKGISMASDLPFPTCSGHSYTPTGGYGSTGTSFRQDSPQLKSDTEYWVEACAKNQAGEGTGDAVYFKTLAAPVITDLRSTYCALGKYAYFIEGVSLTQQFTVTIDWKGLTPGRVEWKTPQGTYSESLGADQNSASGRPLDVGWEFGVGGKLTVRAIARNPNDGSDFIDSLPKTANFTVIPPPPGVPQGMLAARTGATLVYSTDDYSLYLIRPTGISAAFMPNEIPPFGARDLGITVHIKARVSIRDGVAVLINTGVYEDTAITAAGVSWTPLITLTPFGRLVWTYEQGIWKPSGQMCIEGNPEDYSSWREIPECPTDTCPWLTGFYEGDVTPIDRGRGWLNFQGCSEEGSPNWSGTVALSVLASLWGPMGEGGTWLSFIDCREWCGGDCMTPVCKYVSMSWAGCDGVSLADVVLDFAEAGLQTCFQFLGTRYSLSGKGDDCWLVHFPSASWVTGSLPGTLTVEGPEAEGDLWLHIGRVWGNACGTSDACSGTTLLVDKFTRIEGEKVQVPDVVGMEQSAATSAIAGAGLVAGMLSRAESKTAAEAYVISQSPPGGTWVEAGSWVNLTIGPMVLVPRIVVESPGPAGSVIRRAGADLIVSNGPTRIGPTYGPLSPSSAPAYSRLSMTRGITGQEDVGQDEGDLHGGLAMQSPSGMVHGTELSIGSSGPGAGQMLSANTLTGPGLAIAVDNGELLLSWIRDDPNQLSANRTQIVFSRSDGDAWTSPRPIHDDGTADFSPQLAALPAGQVLCAWENLNRPVPDDKDLAGAASAMEIAVASYRGTTGVWNAQMLTSNSHLDRDPVISAADNGKALVVWVSNEKNDILGRDPNARNTICYSFWNGSTWSQPAIAATGIPCMRYMPGNTALAYNGTQAVYVYAVDADSDWQTYDDQELYGLVYDGAAWSQPLRLTDDAALDLHPQVVFDRGEPLLVWCREGSVVSCRNLDITSLQQIVSARVFRATDFRLAKSPAGYMSLVWNRASIKLGHADIFTVTYDPASNIWSSAYPLTSESDSDRMTPLAATYAGRDELAVAYNRIVGATTDTDNASEPNETELAVLSYVLARDLAVSAKDISISEADPKPGSVVKLTAVIHNLGDVTEANVPVAFYHGDPAEGAMIGDFQTIRGPIPAGGTGKAAVSWTIPQADSTQQVFVTAFVQAASPTDLPERDRANNTASISVLVPDLTVESLFWAKTGYKARKITARITNDGVVSAQNVQVSMRLDSPDGQELGQFTIPVIRAHSAEEISWDWNITDIKFRDPEVVLCVVADGSHRILEMNEENNANLCLVHVSKTGDITDDGSVDYEDMSILTSVWLDTSSGPNSWPGGDLDQDDHMNLRDFAHLANDWGWEAIWHTE